MDTVTNNRINQELINYINNIPLKYKLGNCVVSDWIKYKPENIQLLKDYNKIYGNILINDSNTTLRVIVLLD